MKKSQLYSSLWSSCDELRGGMDASQYKDYVLVMLFVKYVSDKYKDEPFGAIVVPEGSSFADMLALKGSPNIGDDLNKLVIGPLFKANNLSTPPDFNDATRRWCMARRLDLMGLLGPRCSSRISLRRRRR